MTTTARRTTSRVSQGHKNGKTLHEQEGELLSFKFDPKNRMHREIIKKARELGIETTSAKKANKIPITIRLDPDIVDALRSMGEGWQPKTNDLLRKWLKL